MSFRKIQQVSGNNLDKQSQFSHKQNSKQNKLITQYETEVYPQPKTYTESRYRHLNLIIYLLAALVNSLPTQTFSSINSLVETKFHFNQVLLTLNTLIFPIFHPVFAFPANWILDRFGMKVGCCVGGVLVIAGVWMRTFMRDGEIGVCLGGSALAAVGNIFILNSSSILANNWFKHSSVPLVITLAVLANLVSITLGGGLPGLLLNGNKSTNEDIINFLRVQAIVISVPFVLLFIFMRSRPKTPPSKAAQMQQKSTQSYAQVLKKLAKNKQYLKIMFMMTLSYGTVTSFLANCEQFLTSLKYSNSIILTSFVILSAMSAGIVSSFVFIKFIKETLQYRRIIALCSCGGFVTFAVMLVLAFVGFETWSTLLIGALSGVFSIPVTSLYLAYSSEVIFPLGEASATGYLFAASQTFGFLIGLGSASLIENYKSNTDPDKNGWQLYLFAGAHVFFLFCSFIMSLFIKNKLKKTKFLATDKNSKLFQQENSISSGFLYSFI